MSTKLADELRAAFDDRVCAGEQRPRHTSDRCWPPRVHIDARVVPDGVSRRSRSGWPQRSSSRSLS